jgi:hypothetical protein
MKRIAILFVATALSALAATAQTEVGKFSLKPMAGINVSDISADDEADYNVKVGFTGGVEAEYGVTPWLGVSLGAMYSQQGAKIKASLSEFGVNEEGRQVASLLSMKGKLKADYINMPLLANFYVWKGLSIKTGVQVGFLVNDKMNVDAAMARVTVPYTDKITYVDLSTPSPNNFLSSFGFEDSDICKSVVFGIPVGLSYEYKNITLDARYYFGLTRMDDAEEDPAARNLCLSITLGYKFKL